MSFRDIYGHEKKIEIIRKTLAQNRVGHAYLFSGSQAIGKRTLAGEWIKALNCEKVDDLGDSCGECASCRKIGHESHPDIFSVEADGQFIRIDAIREIQKRVKCKPLEARIRAFIIDNADKMNDQAANALLKMLEEPSPSNILILVTARPYSLPQTIVSRCQHMRFNPLSSEAVAKFLVERMGMDNKQALLLAALSGGSIGNALELNKEDIVAYRTELLSLLSMTHTEDPFSLINFASFLGQGKKEIRQGLNILKTFFRDALVFKEVRHDKMLINQDHSSFIAACASRLSGEQILQNIAQVEKAGEILDQNVNKSLTLETMAFKLNY
ncbi:MAG: DNA polymerase III subunit delta' [Deltaproteobacteria bacterium HGW-Deltaproteobacteria-13]|jgi:DNA polymerase-3 subunit delta'|nr:MAG: DNA polymerase III subunit delta' [Deltaproteobacteria bacterium HGW-Deltaproteobacteria-13]